MIINQVHRGYQLGYTQGPHGFKAAWRLINDSKWIEGHIYVDTLEDAEKLAKECIDFNIKIAEKEKELGRKLRIDELHLL